MGGEAAKERRRLKRLEAQDKGDGTATPSGQKPIEKKSDAPKQTKVNGEKGNSSSTELQLRIQRKMARKSSGQFKAFAAQNPKPPAPVYKRKSEDSDNNRNPSNNMFKRSPNDHSSKQNTPYKGNANTRFKKDFQPSKQNNTTKPKVKKPKHLKRKMDQLSKTIAEGNSISDLEDQMKQLAKKMEELKKLKQKDITSQDKPSLAVESKDDVGKDKQSLVVESKDDVGKDKQSLVVESKDDVGKDKLSLAVESKEDGGKDHSDEKIEDEPQQGGSEEKSVNKRKKESSNDSSIEDTKVTKSDESKSKESSSSSSSSSSSDEDSSDDDSSDDEDEIAESSNARSRGKRGRGRIDNNPEVKVEEPVSKKTSKKDDKRRCIGRKPITDYVIGKTYSGPVKYIKPKLGAFIDLGAHSDAFCHISCISDTFVSSVMDVLKVGDVVENARVVEIDREKKRITVSLRSEEMAGNEQDKLKTTRQYENGLKSRNWHSGRNSATENSPKKEGYVRFDAAESKANANSGHMGTNDVSNPTKSTPDLKVERKPAPAERREETVNYSPAGGFAQGHWQSAASYPSQSGQKSGADLKRERKLARRADRRAAKEDPVS